MKELSLHLRIKNLQVNLITINLIKWRIYELYTHYPRSYIIDKKVKNIDCSVQGEKKTINQLRYTSDFHSDLIIFVTIL